MPLIANQYPGVLNKILLYSILLRSTSYVTRQPAAQDDDEDIEWEKEDEDDAFTTETTPASLAKCNSAGVKDLAEDREKQQQHQEEEKDEPEERRVRANRRVGSTWGHLCADSGTIHT